LAGLPWSITLTKPSRPAADKRRPKSDAQDGSAEVAQRPVYAAEPFSLEEIASEDRRPKRKVAVLIGYSGTGYKGMQILPDHRTIEGDLFHAFVAARAISKANANDPKKSQLVRCARTDKGVHAAGNLISLKLIIEDEDVVEKINSNLPPEIRVWGIQRTTGSFNCYGACDSRMYEYLIPTHCFLPPLPSSWLGKRLVDIATEDGKLEEYNERQKDVSNFWEEAEVKYVRPALESLDAGTRELVEQAIYKMEDVNALLEDEPEPAEDNDDGQVEPIGDSGGVSNDQSVASAPEPSTELAQVDPKAEAPERRNPELEAAIRSVKAAYIQAKKAYRISDARLQCVRDAFQAYEGTHNFHNFTVGKSSRDPSAKRYIMSFKPDAAPITIGGTEWLSLKVHGMSFMLHQIRKMVSMAAFVVRCATPMERMSEAMTPEPFDVPKAPGLGLLLERPLFDAYNRKAKGLEREAIDFGRYEKEMVAFKQRHIYDQIFRVEEEEHV
jgi:tRNA pseudouridine38-40 synthase